MSIDGVKALTFDVFGSVVDWLGSVSDEVAALKAAKGWDIDPAEFAVEWRRLYNPSMDRVRNSEEPWKHLDTLHRESLDSLLARYGIASDLDAAEIGHLNRVWHRLRPWPDSVSGMSRLAERYVLCSLSNGNFALLTNLAKQGSLPFDAILGAENFLHYKPDPEVYLGAAALLGLEPHEVMMTAAHNEDLTHAREQGLRTAYINRPYEWGDAQHKDFEAASDWDVIADDFNDMADKLGL